MAQPKKETDTADEFKAALSQAYKSMSQQNWLEAIEIFRSILDQAPDKHSLLEAIASCHEGREEYLRAAEYYEKAIGEAPDERAFLLHYRLAVARGCAGRIDKAINALQRANEMEDPLKEAAQIDHLIKTLEDIKRGDKHERYFLVNVQLQRVFADMDEENFDSAEARLRKIALIEPENEVIFYNLGVALSLLKREDEAMEAFQRCVDLNPMYAASWYNMGQICLLKKKDYSRALNYFNRACAARPDYVGAHHQMGVAYELIGDPDKAVASWKKALELDPYNSQAEQNINRLQEST
jgi:tetratricopeptide (TPR) repeat protein